MTKLISFVIPCYRSEKTIEMVINEIIETISKRMEYGYEIICVNDFSPDKVYDVLKVLAQRNDKIKVVNLSKNMGKHSAVMAGYSVASGDYIVNLDDDFQCPSYELWKLIEPLENDACDFATAHYYKKKQASFKNFGSSVTMLMSHIIFNKPLDLRLENFSAMKRFVMEEILKYTNPFPYLEGLILRVTMRILPVPMNERTRADNNLTGFTFKKSLSLFLNGFTAFSVKPLRIASILGALFAAVGFIYGLYVIVNKIIHDVPIGYTTIVILILIIGGLIMLMLGIIGEYIGRIYICINQSPQYVIKETINIKNKHI